MGKSKFQAKARENINKKSTSGSRAKYYDEEINPKKSSGFAIFFIVMIVIAGGVVGIGSLLDNTAEDNSLNPNYSTDTNTYTEDPETGYKTDLDITTIDGTIIHLADYEGKVVIFYFNFIDCPACKQHSPNLQSASELYTSNQLLILSINVKAADSVDAIQEYADEQGFTWKNVKDTDYSLSSRFGSQYVPHTVYFAKDGSVGTTQTGPQTIEEIQTNINNLL
ncbi:TlpA family protein disulfide reductase [Promethearchaeum syntrophicum]|uniref:TlpA family protein disulfide reductase n=1 Tax=Promethearchaeum syntrophicum TaxID=2594042 RepID=A0A5B9DFM8_9ARCH|nr:TlpA family protein disulfide reductase [Candidatus Prometheoarchaeum syntrophicum]QEE17517.1 thiol-disulfide oxidoreductase [Candidatus Prometheoarchaeum syntrophicum]